MACVEAPTPAPPGAPADGRLIAPDAAPPEPGHATPEGPRCETARFWADSGREGATITLSGTVSGESVGAGMVLLDLVADSSGQVVWGFTCDRPGAFSVSVPAGLGAVKLAVWLDGGGDGPSDDDARGEILDLVIEQADVGALVVSVSAP
jgi:hypothetical protein